MPDSLIVGGQLGNYLLESVVGRGGMSVVYRGQHVRLGTVVAIKVLAEELGTDDKFRERFLREARTAASIDHPNVIPIYDTGIQGDSLYLVMKYVPGGDLRQLLRDCRRLTPERAVSILAPAARALDAAHAYGLVHRDVKPANILLQRSPSGEVEQVYLSDFGVMKHTTSASGLTNTGALVGTIDYMAPEQIQGQSVAPETDVYALGCLFYQCVTGRLPFERESEAAVLWAQVRDQPARVSEVLPGLPPALDAPIGNALAKAPAARYPTCEAFIEACRGAVSTPEQRPADLGPAEFRPTITGDSPGPPPPPSPVAPATAGDSAPGPYTRAEEERAAPAAGPPPSSDQPRSAEVAHRPPKRGRLAGRPWLWGLGAALVAAAIAVGVVLSTNSSSSSSSSSGSSTSGNIPATLKPVPVNRVTGHGSATVVLNGNVATVTVHANGLVDGSHAMHFHAGGKGVCPPASAARNHNGHQAISTTDGVAYYGHPVTALTKRGDTSADSILAFGRFPHASTYVYTRKITLKPGIAAGIRRNTTSVIVHGIDYNGNGIYDNVIDRSDLNQSFPGEITAPALCGPLVASKAAGGSGKQHAGAADVYTASLTYRPGTDQPGVRPTWYCHVGGAFG